MTAIVTQATIAVLTAASYETVSATFGAIAIILLLGLLMLKELARSRAGREAVSLRVFDIAAVPLLVTFGLVILQRLLALLGL